MNFTLSTIRGTTAESKRNSSFILSHGPASSVTSAEKGKKGQEEIILEQ